MWICACVRVCAHVLACLIAHVTWTNVNTGGPVCLSHADILWVCTQLLPAQTSLVRLRNRQGDPGEGKDLSPPTRTTRTCTHRHVCMNAHINTRLCFMGFYFYLHLGLYCNGCAILLKQTNKQKKNKGLHFEHIPFSENRGSLCIVTCSPAEGD